MNNTTNAIMNTNTINTNSGSYGFEYIHRRYPNIMITDITVRSWIEQWAPRKASSMDSAEAPHIISRMKRFLEIIGDHPLQALDLDTLQNCVNTLYSSGYPSSSYRQNIAHLSQACNAAVLKHYLAFNPCMGLRVPKYHPAQKYGLSDDEYRLFLEKSSDSEYALFYRTIIAAALRFGEALALTWRQINFDRKTFIIDQQITMRPLPDGSRHNILVPYSKNRKKGTIHPQIEIFALLEQEKERQMLICRQNNIPWNERNFVFNKNGKPLSRPSILADFSKITESIGRPDLRLHDLRHTGARIKLRETTDIWAVRDLLRHSRLGTTVSYLYTTPEDMKEGVIKLNNWLARYQL